MIDCHQCGTRHSKEEICPECGICWEKDYTPYCPVCEAES